MPVFRGWTNPETGKREMVEVERHPDTLQGNPDTLQSIGFFIQSITPILKMLPGADSMGINLRPMLRAILSEMELTKLEVWKMTPEEIRIFQQVNDALSDD